MSIRPHSVLSSVLELLSSTPCGNRTSCQARLLLSKVDEPFTQCGVLTILGLGGLGHLALQYASKSGYRTVAISSSAAKKDFATQLGAHEYIDGSKGDVGKQLQELGGAACILMTAPSSKLIPKLVGGLGPRGKLVILAATEGPTQLDTNSMIQKGLSISAWPSGHATDCEDAISFAQVHGVNCMIEKFSLDQANEALEKMEAGHVRFRGVLTPNN